MRIWTGARRMRLGALLAAMLLAAALPAQDSSARGERALLEQRVRERLAQVVRARVGLDDEQMRRLGATNERYEQRRRDLLARERRARMELRAEIGAGDRADQRHVAQLLDQLIDVQRQRISLVEEEQRELSAFMTPVQRAKYLAVQERVRRSMEEMRRERRRAREGAAPAAPGRRAPSHP